MTMPNDPTSYPAVNAVLRLLLQEVRGILGPEFVGMYCYGSLSLGDFEPGSSDIDFLVVSAHELPESMLHALDAMHARIAASGLLWAEKLEGSYIPRATLRRYDPANNRHPTIGMDWPRAWLSLGYRAIYRPGIRRGRGRTSTANTDRPRIVG